MDNLTSYLQSMRHEDEETAAQDLAQELNIPYINLVGYPIVPEVINIIPETTARQYRAVAFMHTDNRVRVALVNPQDNIIKALDSLAETNHYQFSYVVCSQTSLDYALSLYHKIVAAPEKTGEVKVSTKEELDLSQIKTLGDLQTLIKKVSTTTLLDLIFAGALKTEASDIHLEPEADDLRIRYRIDGVLQEIASLPLANYHPLNSRLKNLAGMKLDIRNTPQDGRFSINALGESLDIRAATMPATYGEIIDLRLLSGKNKLIDIGKLGFRPDALKMIKEAINRPHGLVLNTGPTGSGKTTTLYAILARLNKPGVNIITLEDPIEYHLPGIDQVQIDIAHDYTFAKALRATLRQDPNIIMIGEIRDKETAEIGLQAAMTGHLVLSTLHTNNAPGALTRLMDMGIEPYLLAGAINLIIAQRLVRRLCTNCEGKGCEICNATGFKGRVAIVECFKPSPAIDKLMTAKAPLSEFIKAAKQEGMKTMEEDGMDKVAQGITTKEEIWRVTKE